MDRELGEADAAESRQDSGSGEGGLKPRRFGRSALLIAGGWTSVAVAIAVLIELDLGVAPYDVLNVGLGRVLGVAPGTAMWVSGAVLVAIAWMLGRRPGVATPLGFIAIGLLINAVLPLVPDIDSQYVRAVAIIPVLALLYLGVCLIIISRLGAGPTEVLMLALNDKGLSLRKARWIIEVACAVGGFALGGPIGVLTGMLVLMSAPIIAALLPRTERIVGKAGLLP